MIAIINYGIGNLGSVKNALDYLGFESIITSDRDVIINADKVILPGVGAFGVGMDTLKKLELDKVVYELAKNNTPILGICLGMQLLFQGSYEHGYHKGLGLLDGEIVKFSANTEDKIPQIGWNQIEVVKNNSLFKNLDNSNVYFVHSYYLSGNDKDAVCYTEYAGVRYPSAVAKNNIYATQFHPEKSGGVGLEILRNFGEL